MKDSEIVMAVANLASQGTYKEVTPQGARNMNTIFEAAAGLINKLEEAERIADEELNKQGQEADWQDQEGFADVQAES
jgi:hypothetical protein